MRLEIIHIDASSFICMSVDKFDDRLLVLVFLKVLMYLVLIHMYYTVVYGLALCIKDPYFHILQFSRCSRCFLVFPGDSR